MNTPRTDANYVCHYGDGLGQWVPREFAYELERELAAAIAQRDKCANCDGRGHDIEGLIGAGNTTFNRQCHVCKGSGLRPRCDSEASCEGIAQKCAVAIRALKERYCALEGEMLVLKDQLTCALLQERENFEIANKFKHTMEEYRQRETAAYIALREAAGLLSTTPKFSCETPEYIMEYLLNAPREKE